MLSDGTRPSAIGLENPFIYSFLALSIAIILSCFIKNIKSSKIRIPLAIIAGIVVFILSIIFLFFLYIMNCL